MRRPALQYGIRPDGSYYIRRAPSSRDWFLYRQYRQRQGRSMRSYLVSRQRRRTRTRTRMRQLPADLERYIYRFAD